MQSVTSTLGRATRIVAVLSIAAAGLLGGTGSARADGPTVIDEDATGFLCEYYPEGQPQVIASIHYDAASGSGYSSAEVLAADGEMHLAEGFTDDVQVADGVVSARYPLTGVDGSTAGEVVLTGTYAATAMPVTLHNRYPYERNAQILGTLTYTPLEVTWTTFQVGDYDVSGMSCDGQRSESHNRVLEPHRYVRTFNELNVLGRCASGDLTGFSIVPSEVGVSVGLSTEGYEGFTNLDLADGSDTQSVAWYAGDAEGPAEFTSMTVTLAEDGHSRTMVEATPDGLVLAQIQPLTLAYQVGLPGDAGVVSGSCAAEATILRTAVEPIDG
jgi:hypothetical protein